MAIYPPKRNRFGMARGNGSFSPISYSIRVQAIFTCASTRIREATKARFSITATEYPLALRTSRAISWQAKSARIAQIASSSSSWIWSQSNGSLARANCQTSIALRKRANPSRSNPQRYSKPQRVQSAVRKSQA